MCQGAVVCDKKEPFCILVKAAHGKEIVSFLIADQIQDGSVSSVFGCGDDSAGLLSI